MDVGKAARGGRVGKMAGVGRRAFHALAQPRAVRVCSRWVLGQRQGIAVPPHRESSWGRVHAQRGLCGFGERWWDPICIGSGDPHVAPRAWTGVAEPYGVGESGGGEDGRSEPGRGMEGVLGRWACADAGARSGSGGSQAWQIRI